MPTSGPAGIDYQDITSKREIPFEKDPLGPSTFGGHVDAVKPTSRFQSKFQGQEKFVRKKIVLDLSDTEQDSKAQAKRLFHREVKNLYHARHHHVIEITMAYFFAQEQNEEDDKKEEEEENQEDEQDAYFAIIMPRADGSLRHFMDRMRSSDDRKKKLVSQWFGCLAKVTEYIHGIGIRHRDIKPENILYKGDKIMFADFGISKMGLGKTLSTTVPQWMRTATPKYVSPEVDAGSTRGRSAEIFSLGTVFLEMLLAHSYRSGRQRLGKIIKADGGPSYVKNLASVRAYMDEIREGTGDDGAQWQKTMLDLCAEMLEDDREKRPSAERVYSVVSSLSHSRGSPGPCGCIRQEDLSGAQKLVEACKKSDGLEEVESLLRTERPDTIGAIHQAAARGFRSIVKAFVDKKIDINLADYSNQTALHCAASYGHEGVVGLLLRKGAKVDAKDDEEKTPIHCAAGQGRLRVLDMLLRQDKEGTAVAAQNADGQTALHCAARRGNIEVVQILLENMVPADVAKPDSKKRTALHLAAGYGSEEVVCRLLAVVAPESVDEQDENRWAPLHFAVLGKQPDGKYREVIELLLKRGANSRTEDIQHNNPWFYAEKDHRDDILECMKADDRNQVSDPPGSFRPSWKRATKIYQILEKMDIQPKVLREIMNRLVECGITDVRLPLKGRDVGRIFSPKTCAIFEKIQDEGLSTTLRCEGLGEHSSLRTDEWQSNWEPMEKLGEGNSGEVHKVKSSDTGKVFALKLIRRGVGDNEARAEEELSLLKRVAHNHIISLVGSFTSPSLFGLLMVPAAQFNLDQYLCDAATDPDKISLLWSYFGCLVNALCHLHYTAYVRHNDIKPQNILVDGSRVLLTDFGISLDWSETLRTTTFGPAPMTPMYSAPETTDEDQSRNTFSDIWSLGCVFLEMMTVIKGRSADDLRQYLREQSARNSAYSKNIPHIRRWMVILEANMDDPEKRFLKTIDDMLTEKSQLRPTAERVRQDMLGMDVESTQSFFGDCCKTKSRTKKEVDAAMSQDEISDKFSIEKHTSIAATSWPGEQRLFFQGTDGTIRQAFRKEDQFWKADRMENAIATGRLCTPIAAAAWLHTTGHRQPTVRVYFLDESSYIQERTWNPLSEWAIGSLSGRFKAASFSQLAVTSWNEGNIILFYQSDEGTIHTLHGWATEDIWKTGSTHPGASAGCSLAALNFEHFGNRGVRLYYESEDSMIREACWDNIHDKYRNDPNPYLGGYRLPDLMGSSVSGVAWKEEELEMRLYLGGEHGIFEHRYGGVWQQTYRLLEKLLPEGQISVLRGSACVNIYFVEREGLMEAERSRGTIIRTTILPNVVCSGSGCPGKLARRVPRNLDRDALSQSPSASAATEDDGRQADGLEADGQEAGTQATNGQDNHGHEGFRQEIDRQGYVAHERIEQEDFGQEDDAREVDGQSVDTTGADPEYTNADESDGDGAAGGQPDRQESDSIHAHGCQSVDVEPDDEEYTTVVPSSQVAQRQPPSTNIPEAETRTRPPQDGDGLIQRESGWLRFKRQWRQRFARYCCYCC